MDSNHPYPRERSLLLPQSELARRNRLAAIDSGAYWIALFEDKTALLLAGSISNAVGASSMGPHDAISPSADPIGTVELAFGEGRSAEDKVNVGCKCAYIWQTIVEPVLADWHGLPSVEGIAVYGGVPILYPHARA
jgi:hypothetical protein